MTNLVFINLVEVLLFFMWFFNSFATPFMIVVAGVYIILELGWVGLLGPFLLFLVAIWIKKV
jgi:hypothetical protein